MVTNLHTRFYKRGCNRGAVDGSDQRCLRESRQPTVILTRTLTIFPEVFDRIEVHPNSIILCPPPLLYILSLCQLYTRVYPPTCSECPTHSFTIGATICSHNEVVGGVHIDLVREGDGSCGAVWSGRCVPGGQVVVRCICTVVNGAVVPWLECALHKYNFYVG